MSQLTVRQLHSSELAQAWPLVRTAARYSSAEAWQRSAGNLIGRGGGVVAIGAEDGCFHGIATYEPVPSPRGGRVLQVDTLATFEFSRRAPVRHALCEALFGFARLFDCEAISVPVSSRSWLRQRLGAADGRPEAGLAAG